MRSVTDAFTPLVQSLIRFHILLRNHILPYIVQLERSWKFVQLVCCVRLFMLPESHRLRKWFGTKVAQTRISEHVVPVSYTHLTLPTKA